MVRQYHRMVCMDGSKLTKHIYTWDRTLNDRNIVNTWSNEVKSIFSNSGLLATFEANLPLSLDLTIPTLKSAFKIKQQEYLSSECAEMPKLRTFILFKEFQEPPAYITKPLTFHQRRMVAKTRLGCLPIRLETGRYSIPRLTEEERTCLVCRNQDQLVVIQPTNTNDPVESETHFLFFCPAYTTERDLWLSKMSLPSDFMELPENIKLKIVLNDPSNVKFTSQFITNSFNIRSKILK